MSLLQKKSLCRKTTSDFFYEEREELFELGLLMKWLTSKEIPAPIKVSITRPNANSNVFCSGATKRIARKVAQPAMIAVLLSVASQMTIISMMNSGTVMS